MTFNHHAVCQTIERTLIGNALHLYPVCPRMLEFWISEPVLEVAVIRQQEQALAVTVQPPDGIDPLHRNIVRQRGPLAGKLGQHVIRLIERDVYMAQANSLQQQKAEVVRM